MGQALKNSYYKSPRGVEYIRASFFCASIPNHNYLVTIDKAYEKTFQKEKSNGYDHMPPAIRRGEVMKKYAKKHKSKEEVADQKKAMQESAEKEQDAIWYEEETMKRFLKFAASFHQYSYNNQLLIHAKFPNAAMVATYGGWIKKGRKVKPAESKNYAELFAPQPKAAYVTEKIVDEDGNETEEKKRVSYMDYRVVYVYDASQTEGDRLPELVHENEDPVFETEADMYHALKLVSPGLQEHMSPCEMLRCLSQHFLQEQYKTVIPHEVDACAFVLSSYLQLGDSDYSTKALFDWAKGKGRKEITGTMERMQRTCKQIIGKMEGTECFRYAS